MAYAIDAVHEISESTFRCLAKMNVSVYFARIWSPANNGEADKTGVSNIRAATNAGLCDARSAQFRERCETIQRCHRPRGFKGTCPAKCH
ncbi:hypothetical protein M3Y99_00670300 [Aphelenchoides fujianensis]|nr:hypothetical protein M3Y99_00670300 [Aphelenchoides fujianensis]